MSNGNGACNKGYYSTQAGGGEEKFIQEGFFIFGQFKTIILVKECFIKNSSGIMGILITF